MIVKIKATAQQISTFTDNNAIKHYSYDERFLNGLLGVNGKYEISDKNANVTWYELKKDEPQEQNDTQETPQETTDELTDEQKDVHFGQDAIDILESDGYEITDGAKKSIIEKSYTVSDLKEIAVDNKITGLNLKKLK